MKLRFIMRLEFAHQRAGTTSRTRVEVQSTAVGPTSVLGGATPWGIWKGVPPCCIQEGADWLGAMRNCRAFEADWCCNSCTQTCKNDPDCQIASWHTGEVTTMAKWFSPQRLLACWESFSEDLSDRTTSKVRGMSCMFKFRACNQDVDGAVEQDGDCCQTVCSGQTCTRSGLQPAFKADAKWISRRDILPEHLVDCIDPGRGRVPFRDVSVDRTRCVGARRRCLQQRECSRLLPCSCPGTSCGCGPTHTRASGNQTQAADSVNAFNGSECAVVLLRSRARPAPAHCSGKSNTREKNTIPARLVPGMRFRSFDRGAWAAREPAASRVFKLAAAQQDLSTASPTQTANSNTRNHTARTIRTGNDVSCVGFGGVPARAVGFTVEEAGVRVCTAKSKSTTRYPGTNCAENAVSCIGFRGRACSSLNASSSWVTCSETWEAVLGGSQWQCCDGNGNQREGGSGRTLADTAKSNAKTHNLSTGGISRRPRGDADPPPEVNAKNGIPGTNEGTGIALSCLDFAADSGALFLLWSRMQSSPQPTPIALRAC
eukprot:2039310-Rhodomonas_salina.3